MQAFAEQQKWAAEAFPHQEVNCDLHVEMTDHRQSHSKHMGHLQFVSLKSKEISMDSGTRQVKAKQSGTSNKTCVALQRPKQKATDNNYTNIISCICSFPLCGGV